MTADTVYKIALAAYLHDIGKFAERAKGMSGIDERGFFPSEEFIDNNRDLYQPYFQGKYTHSHAVYTAAFIDHLEKLLPDKLNKGQWGLGDSFVNLAAGHHKPETPMQWIIAVADRVSSGFDRTKFEESYNREIEVKDYKKTRLLTLFEGLSLDNKSKLEGLENYRYRYPLKELSPYNIFPKEVSELQPIDGAEASEEYKKLFSSFINALEKLSHKKSVSLWFEHFDSLFMIFTSHIPAATVGNVVPDVSLYDHSRTTSAIAAALYQYHFRTNTLTVDAIKDYEPDKFLLITGDFYGIQDFIFTEGGSTGKASAKLLRGRSFYVSLLSELAADMLCRELGLPVTSIILNAAGKFTILAYNTDEAKNIIDTIESKINKWLIKNFFGQASMGISFVEASCNDFISGRFADLWQRLSKSIDRKKYSRFDISKYSGAVENYLDSFDNRLGICPFCGKRPASGVVVRDEYSCKICRDHIFIGTHLVKDEQIAITTIDADLRGEKLLEPIYDMYQIAFVSGEMNYEVKKGRLLKFWNIGISKDGIVSKNITAKFLNGYVPIYETEELTDKAIDRILAGKKTERKKEELFDEMIPGIPKTFAYIAKTALIEDKEEGKFKGIEAIGIFKADVDNLGLLFGCGIPRERFTISRLATLSRQINNYFTIFLPYKLMTDDRFKNIYTVFTGGDDLFLIGPWNKIIEFAGFLNKSFKDYVCQNEKITISAGVALHKPNTPVLTLAETSEHALHASKSKGRDSITIFGETVKWNKFINLEGIKNTIHEWLDSETINNAMIFRLNEFIEMRRQEEKIKEEIKAGGQIHIEDMECLKWHSRFKYTVVRNIGKGLKGDAKEKAIEEVMKVTDWLETHKGALKIPLWQVIYNRR